MTHTDSQRPRIDWYQTDAYVSVSLFVKGVSQATANGVVGNDGRTVTVSYDLPSTSSSTSAEDSGGGGSGSCQRTELQLNLSHPVIGEGIQFSVKPTRIDLRLNKREPGVRWAVLEGRDDSALPALAAAPAPAEAQLQPQPQQQHKAKNWDAIAKSIEEDKLEGDAALNDLFQKIYSDGSDEQRKAMVKSFTESGGTVLSTNWNEIGKAKVEVKPPDGMEYKKWDS